MGVGGGGDGVIGGHGVWVMILLFNMVSIFNKMLS